MALLKTNQATAQQSGLVASSIDGNDVTGRLAYAFPVYTTTGAEAAADILDIVELPVGATFLPSLSRVSSEACGGTGFAIASLGDGVSGGAAAVTAARYSSTAISLVTAASSAVTPAVAQAAVPTAVTEATNCIKGTIALSSGSVTAGKKVQFIIAYRMP